MEDNLKKVNKPKYIRFYTLMTYLDRYSERTPLKFKFDYKGLDGTFRSAYIEAWAPWGESISLEKDAQYMCLMRWNHTKGSFSLLSATPAEECAKRTVWNRKNDVVVGEIKKVECDHECYLCDLTIDGIKVQALSYNKPDYSKKITPSIVPYMVPVMVDGKVTPECYRTSDDGSTYLRRTAGCLVKF